MRFLGFISNSELSSDLFVRCMDVKLQELHRNPQGSSWFGVRVFGHFCFLLTLLANGVQ